MANVNEEDRRDEAPATEQEEAKATVGDGGETLSPHRPDMNWYVLKVTVGREEQVRDSILKRARLKGLEDCFGQIIIPTEKVTEHRGGRKRITEYKLFAGYLIIQMVMNDDTWMLVRETPGVSDFLAAQPGKKPLPMTDQEVERMLGQVQQVTAEEPKLKVNYREGDLVKIKEGPFENFEGVVEEILPDKGQVRVIVEIFGRQTPIEVAHWQLEKVT